MTSNEPGESIIYIYIYIYVGREVIMVHCKKKGFFCYEMLVGDSGTGRITGSLSYCN